MSRGFSRIGKAASSRAGACGKSKNMFTPKTERIKELAEKYPEVIEKMAGLFSANTAVYIDYANVRPWAEKLQWHVEPRRLKQFLQSFGIIRSVILSGGTQGGFTIAKRD